MSRTTLYVKADCRYCAAARDALSARGVPFTVVDVGDSPEVIPELLKLTKGARVVPVVVEGGRILVAPEGGSPF